MYKYTVDRGKLLGIDVWIYDENSYPSGFAGGHVYRQMPEAYNQGAGLMPTVVGVMPATCRNTRWSSARKAAN